MLLMAELTVWKLVAGNRRELLPWPKNKGSEAVSEREGVAQLPQPGAQHKDSLWRRGLGLALLPLSNLWQLPPTGRTQLDASGKGVCVVCIEGGLH